MKKIFTFLALMFMLSFSSQAAIYIVGDGPFGGWNPGGGVEMTEANGVYTYTTTINGAVWFLFGDGQDSDWGTFNANYRIGPLGNSDETVSVGTWVSTQKAPDGSKSYMFTGTGGEYTFTFNPHIMKFKIEGYVAPIVVDYYTVAGAPASVFGNEWAPDDTNNDMTKLSDGTYELKKFGCELAEGTNIAFKVVGNHSWQSGLAWPNDDYIYPIEETGVYNVTFTFNPVNNLPGITVEKAGEVNPVTGELYVLGNVNGNGWDPSVGVKMDTEDQNIFTTTITTVGENLDDNDGIGYSYFAFTTKLGQNSDDWSIGVYRVGAPDADYLLSEDQFGIPLTLGGFGNTNSYKITAGTFDLTVNLAEMTMTITPAEGPGPDPEPEFKFEKIWEVTDVSFLSAGDARQGFGMNGKFYVNDKANQTINVIGKNGLTTTTYPGGANCGLTRDEAGNLVVSNAVFPEPWTAEATIKVINPETNEEKEYIVPSECGVEGRCDFLGFAKGNLMENGVLYLTGASTNGVAIMTIADGEVNLDECYLAPCDGLSPTSSTVINYYTDLAGEEALLYVTRNAAPQKLVADGDGFTATPITVPAKGTCNGMFPFVWDGKQLYAYPQEPNYQNGFAIAEEGAEEPMITVASTVEGNANTFQGDWINAEVNDNVVIIYQYYPGGNFTVYRLSKETPEPEPTNPPTITAEETEDGVVITVTGEGEIHVYVDGVEVENPYTIPYGDEEVTVTVTATAQAEGQGVSETVTLVVVVPAKSGGETEEGYKIVKVWEITDVSFLSAGDARQGFGMNSKFYVNDKANQTICVIGKNGLTNTSYPGGANCGLTRDEAGNLVVSNAVFPEAWTAEATIKVINPETNEMKEYVVPTECGVEGRCDFLGFAKGNLMENGVLYLTGASTNGVAIMTIADGEVNLDECYPAPCDGLSPTSSTVINYYTDLAGEEALLYVTRNAAPQKLVADGDGFTATPIIVPAKGTCNGMFQFVWDEKEFFIYPQEPNYQNGFAIAEDGAEAPIVVVESTVTANANTFQGDWLNAEVDDMGVTIYQYYPGGNFTVYRLTKSTGGVEELITDTEKVVAGVRYYNIMGQEMKEAHGLTIVVTTYTDGSSSAVKILK